MLLNCFKCRCKISKKLWKEHYQYCNGYIQDRIICSVCNKPFESTERLDKHFMLHVCTQCTQCSKCFSIAEDMTTHSCGGGKLKLRCIKLRCARSCKHNFGKSLCLIFKLSKTEKLQRIMNHDMKCAMCNFTTSSADSLEDHIRNNRCTVLSGYRCFFCDNINALYASFGSLSSLVSHMKTHVAREGQDSIKLGNDNGTQHETLENRDTLRTDDYLPTVGKNIIQQLLKVRDASNVLKEKSNNDDVHFELESVSVLNADNTKNITWPTKDGKSNHQLKCFSCGKSFSNTTKILKHFRLNHKFRTAQVSLCRNCNTVFKDKCMVYENNCFQCTPTFNATTNRKPRVYVYVCFICQSLFYHINDLITHCVKIHKLTVTAVKERKAVTMSWPCCICNENITTSTHDHVLGHSKDIYECYHCGFIVQKVNELVRHLIVKHNEEWASVSIYREWLERTQVYSLDDVLEYIFWNGYSNVIKSPHKQSSKFFILFPY